MIAAGPSVEEERESANPPLLTDGLDRPAKEANRPTRWHLLILRQLSIVEIAIYMAAAAGFAYHQLLALPARNSETLFYVLTSPDVLIPLGLCFIAYFSLLLNGITPLVNLLARMRGPLDFDRVSKFTFESKDEKSARISTASNEELSQRLAQGLETKSLNTIVPSDSVETNFATYIARSQDAARIAQRRPNALLFVGTIIAAAGLIFFVLTLPGSRYGFLDSTPSAISDARIDFWSSTIQLLPRLLMLIFIQVLAGFFLRQYRSAMEDFRYYESVLRHREAEYLSYSLRKKMEDKRALLKFGDELLKDRVFGQLGRGQTTATLEAQKAEINEFGSIIERLTALLSRAETKSKKT
jgi:hypothetical protein